MRRHDERGDLLLEALFALALLAMIALGAATLATRAVQAMREASELDQARETLREERSRWGEISFARLPLAFGAAPSDTIKETTQPLGALNEGRLELRLEGLARGGASARFDAAALIRLSLRVVWRRGAAVRAVSIVELRG